MYNRRKHVNLEKLCKNETGKKDFLNKANFLTKKCFYDLKFFKKNYLKVEFKIEFFL